MSAGFLVRTSLTRREVALGCVGAGLLVSMVAGCDRKAPPLAAPHAAKAITESVYVVHGPNELPSPQNQGFMNNPAFVITSKGVVVVDPGSSVRVGEMVLARVTEVTNAPVVAVFNTHIHGDHWLGNHAIKTAYPSAVVYAHAQMKSKAPAAGPLWVDRLNRMTDGAIKGTQAVAPDLVVENEDVLKIGNKQFRIYHTGHAHTDGDLMIEVVEDKVMFVGDNVLAGRLPSMDDGHFLGNVAAIDAALASPATHFIPGHGPSDGREALKAYRGYLTTLHASVRKHHAEGLQDFEMKPKVAAALAAYSGWGLFDTELGRHISIVLQQIIAEEF